MCKICATKFSSIFWLHGKHSFAKVINEVWYLARDMIIVDSCMIWFHFHCIMQLKKLIMLLLMFVAETSTTTFCYLPDW